MGSSVGERSSHADCRSCRTRRRVSAWTNAPNASATCSMRPVRSTTSSIASRTVQRRLGLLLCGLAHRSIRASPDAGGAPRPVATSCTSSSSPNGLLPRRRQRHAGRTSTPIGSSPASADSSAGNVRRTPATDARATLAVARRHSSGHVFLAREAALGAGLRHQCIQAKAQALATAACMHRELTRRTPGWFARRWPQPAASFGGGACCRDGGAAVSVWRSWPCRRRRSGERRLCAGSVRRRTRI
jgi:hypothetical protein